MSVAAPELACGAVLCASGSERDLHLLSQRGRRRQRKSLDSRFLPRRLRREPRDTFFFSRKLKKFTKATVDRFYN